MNNKLTVLEKWNEINTEECMWILIVTYKLVVVLMSKKGIEMLRGKERNKGREEKEIKKERIKCQ